MRWEDERYVKVYTRDTPEWCTLSFGARGLFCLILRAVDRAGVLDLGKLGTKGVAVAVRGSWTEVEPLLGELVADGCVTIRDDKLIVPNFIEAQETRQSDAARQRASREKARAVLNVTKRDAIESQNVTESHQLSPAVTSCHSESRVDESRKDKPPISPPSGDVSAVLDYWAETLYPGRKPKYDPKRCKRVKARLAEGFSVEELKRAVDGAKKDDFLMGRLEKSRNGGYRDVCTVLRDAAQVERLAALAPRSLQAASESRIRVVGPSEPEMEPTSLLGVAEWARKIAKDGRGAA
jgi:hypothetical protein